MAPLTCRVIDTLHSGVKGVGVVLECRDRFYNLLGRLESITDGDGGVCTWYSTTPPSVGEIEPRIVDTATIPRVSLTFYPHYHSPAPWISVRTDLFLSAETCHGIILHLETNPRLEHTTYPVAGPMESIAEPIVPCQSRDLQTPSPFQLPSPLYTSPNTSAGESESPMNVSQVEGSIIGRKRKMDSVGWGHSEARRRRLG